MKLVGKALAAALKKMTPKQKRKLHKRIVKAELHKICRKTSGGARSAGFAQGMSYFRGGK